MFALLKTMSISDQKRPTTSLPASPDQAWYASYAPETPVGKGKAAAYTQHRFVAISMPTTAEQKLDLINDLRFTKSPEVIQLWTNALAYVEFDKDIDITAGANGTPLFLTNTVYIFYLRFTQLHVKPTAGGGILNLLGFWD